MCSVKSDKVIICDLEYEAKIEYLKNLVCELDHKRDFVMMTAEKQSKSYTYVLQDWFQKNWKIPKDVIDDVIYDCRSVLATQIKNKSKLINSYQ